MPKEAINLDLLLCKIIKGNIIMDKPLLKYFDETQQMFSVFQDSGLNILLGNEGHGKTKFLTQCIYRFLDLLKEGDPRFKDWKVLYIDTERPESQYAYSIKHIVDKAQYSPDEIFKKLEFLSVMDLSHIQMKEALHEHIEKNPDQKYLIIIDHILPFVFDMNNIAEASEIDLLLKRLISDGHLIIASIHKPSSGYLKGLGHLGSSLQRLASFILEITNNLEGNGFCIKQIKSRISARTNNILLLPKDEFGYIDTDSKPVISLAPIKSEKEDKSDLAKDILREFVDKGLTTKKQLFDIIRKRNDWTEKSSGVYKFYDDFLKKFISFEDNDSTLTDEGKKMIDNELL
ncbi:MAG: hypothetical protein GXC72_07745 [Chitinophagaceae bacterium]|nr:hypothetical protein [Chitinophagaceae bacterium]